jgi:hypothetical protein
MPKRGVKILFKLVRLTVMRWPDRIVVPSTEEKVYPRL